MIAQMQQINIFEKFSKTGVWVGAVIAMIVLSGCINAQTDVTIYEDEQWQGIQTVELSAELAALLEADDSSVGDLKKEIDEAEKLAQQEGLDITFNQQTRDDGSMVLTTAGTGQGFDQLNEIFFDGAANISVQESQGERLVTIEQLGINSSEITDLGGSNLVKISGLRIIDSDADQVQLNTTAIWNNPSQIRVVLTEVAGTPPPVSIPTVEDSVEVEVKAQPEVVNVIENGDFEKKWDYMNGVAPGWEAYDNGQAHFGWYEETWPEAVRKGKGHAQLMEIFEVEANVLDRKMAIYQTVDVASNADYDLTIYAIMRTSAPEPLRNKDEYEMHWGIDPWGEGNYDNVEQWVLMPLEEQYRIGSNAPYPEDIPLFYERITGTVKIGPNTDRITLFIRGLKKFPNGTEVNFDVDDVSLVGPSPGAVIPVAQVSQSEQPPLSPASTETTEVEMSPPAEEDTLPSTGAVLSFEASIGTFALGGLVLIILTTGAAAHLLQKRRDT